MHNVNVKWMEIHLLKWIDTIACVLGRLFAQSETQRESRELEEEEDDQEEIKENSEQEEGRKMRRTQKGESALFL